MLCWANENWTRAWDGLDTEVLLRQDYDFEDDKAHMSYLCDTFFNDIRYIKHEGKPVFLIYRPKLFKDIKKTIETWRNVAADKGIGELHIGYMQSWGVTDEPATMGFDFAVEFQPKFPIVKSKQKSIFQRLGLKRKQAQDRIFDYQKFTKLQMSNKFNPIVSPSLIPMWDNSSRRKTDAFIFTNSSPEAYGNWLQYIVTNYPWKQNKEKFLFINAWNEWAEGNHIEPCQKWGKRYLEITKKVLSKV